MNKYDNADMLTCVPALDCTVLYVDNCTQMDSLFCQFSCRISHVAMHDLCGRF